MYSERSNAPRAVIGNSRDTSVEELARLDETIQEIDAALSAEDFYERDRREVTRSREFFLERRLGVQQRLAERSLIFVQN